VRVHPGRECSRPQVLMCLAASKEFRWLTWGPGPSNATPLHQTTMQGILKLVPRNRLVSNTVLRAAGGDSRGLQRVTKPDPRQLGRFGPGMLPRGGVECPKNRYLSSVPRRLSCSRGSRPRSAVPTARPPGTRCGCPPPPGLSLAGAAACGAISKRASLARHEGRELVFACVARV
jgi:hypothetical protein